MCFRKKTVAMKLITEAARPHTKMASHTYLYEVWKPLQQGEGVVHTRGKEGLDGHGRGSFH